MPSLAGTVLLVVDVQNDVIDLYGRTPWMESVIANIKSLVDDARAHDVPIVYIRVAFRPSFVDVMPNKPMIQERNMMNEREPGADVIDELRPQTHDTIVTKRRTGGFYQTDLELVLRGLNAKTLIVTGMSTARAVESTVREAHNRDYSCIVASDACLADTMHIHENALESMADWFADVMTTAEVRLGYFSQPAKAEM